MATHSVNMIIKARDEASKKLLGVGNAAVSMGSMLKRAAIGIGAYLGVREIARFAKSSIDAFAEEELAVNQLNSALALLGKQGELDTMRQFASEIQKLTIVGDETTLQLMQLGASIGKLSGTQLQEATRAAIGLSKALGIDAKAAMLLVAKAAAGNTSTFSRYGITLDASLSAQEKFNAILKIGADNFKLAEAETKTYSGTIAQLKNAFGDVKELIGNALTPVFKEWAQNITKWLQENQANIGIWAQKAVAYITYAKDVFLTFVNFLKNEFKTGFEASLNATITVFSGFANAITHIAVELGDTIARELLRGVIAGSTSILYFSTKGVVDALIGAAFDGTNFKEHLKNVVDYGKGVANQLIPKSNVDSLEVFKEAGEILTKAIMEASKQLPEDLSKGLDTAWSKLQLQLANAGKSNMAIAASGASGGFTANDNIANSVAKAIRNPSGYTLESGTLRFAPGSSANYQKTTADNTKRTNSLLSEIKQAIKDGYNSDAVTNIVLNETEFA